MHFLRRGCGNFRNRRFGDDDAGLSEPCDAPSAICPVEHHLIFSPLPYRRRGGDNALVDERLRFRDHAAGDAVDDMAEETTGMGIWGILLAILIIAAIVLLVIAFIPRSKK